MELIDILRVYFKKSVSGISVIKWSVRDSRSPNKRCWLSFQANLPKLVGALGNAYLLVE